MGVSAVIVVRAQMAPAPLGDRAGHASRIRFTRRSLAMDSGIPAAGWYDDFEDPTRLRYWDGQAWTGHLQPQVPTPPPAQVPYAQATQPAPDWAHHTPAPARSRPLRIALTIVLLLAGFAGVRSALSHAMDPLSPTLAQPEVPPPARCTDGGTAKVVLPKALTATRPAGRPVITPAGAERVLEETWRVREQALVNCDLPTLRALDTGSARIGDLARAPCACLARVAAPYTESRVFVPRQVEYPAYFVTLAQTKTVHGETWVEVMAFTRRSAKTSWQVNLSTGFLPKPELSDWPQPIADAAGYATSPDESTRSTAAAMPSQLAAYFQAAKDTGHMPVNPFKPGARTTDIASKIAKHRQDTVQRNGLRGHVSFTVSAQDPSFLVRVGDQQAMACAVVRVRSVYTEYHGKYPYQTTDRLNWGAELAPGKYRSVTLAAVMQTCFMIQTAGGPAAVLGGEYLVENTSSGVPFNRLAPQ
jgi:hypothetical protein